MVCLSELCLWVVSKGCVVGCLCGLCCGLFLSVVHVGSCATIRMTTTTGSAIGISLSMNQSWMKIVDGRTKQRTTRVVTTRKKFSYKVINDSTRQWTIHRIESHAGDRYWIDTMSGLSHQSPSYVHRQPILGFPMPDCCDLAAILACATFEIPHACRCSHFIP